MRVFQALRCALVLAAFALAAGAQAAPIHPIAYDPPTGTGSLNEEADCSDPESSTCSIDLLTTLITDSFGNTWQLPAPLINIATNTAFGEGGLFAIQTPFFSVDLVEGDGCGDGCGSILLAFAPIVSQQVGCETANFRLNIDNTTDLVNSCNVENHGIYVIGPPQAAPEPASLALIVGGMTAAWAIRRRRRAA